MLDLYALYGWLFLQHPCRGAKWWGGLLGDSRSLTKRPDVVMAIHFLVLPAYEQLSDEATPPDNLLHLLLLSLFPRLQLFSMLLFRCVLSRAKIPSPTSALYFQQLFFLLSGFCWLHVLPVVHCPLFSCSCSTPSSIHRTNALCGSYVPRHHPSLSWWWDGWGRWRSDEPSGAPLGFVLRKSRTKWDGKMGSHLSRQIVLGAKYVLVFCHSPISLILM